MRRIVYGYGGTVFVYLSLITSYPVVGATLIGSILLMYQAATEPDHSLWKVAASATLFLIFLLYAREWKRVP